MNDILQKLWDLKVREAVGVWGRAAEHPSGQSREREKDIHKLLGSDLLSVNKT